MYLDRRAALPAKRFQPGGVPGTGGGLGDVILDQLGEAVRVGVAQNQNLPLQTALPQLHRLRQRGHSEAPDAQPVQLVGDHMGSVAVGVRLYHAHNPAAGGQMALVLSNIVGQSVPIQLNPCTVHDLTPVSVQGCMLRDTLSSHRFPRFQRYCLLYTGPTGLTSLF